MQRTYYSPLRELITSGKSVILRTEEEYYFVDAVDLLKYLLNTKNVILVTFDRTTRDLVDRVEFEGGSISNLRIIDAVSIVEGRGTPPIQHVIATYRPYDFNDLQVYTWLFAKEFAYENTVVVMLSVDRLNRYQNMDEIGIFRYTFRMQMKRYNIPEVILLHTAISPILAQIISKDVDKIVPVRAAPVFIPDS